MSQSAASLVSKLRMSAWQRSPQRSRRECDNVSKFRSNAPNVANKQPCPSILPRDGQFIAAHAFLPVGPLKLSRRRSKFLLYSLPAVISPSDTERWLLSRPS